MREKVGNPSELFNSVQYGFSQAVRSAEGRLVTLSGQVAWDAQHNLLGEDLYGQTTASLSNLAVALRSVGATLDHVVSLRIYIVDFATQDSSQISRALKETFRNDTPPAATWVGVTALASPALMIEIEATAVTPIEYN